MQREINDLLKDDGVISILDKLVLNKQKQTDLDVLHFEGLVKTVDFETKSAALTNEGFQLAHQQKIKLLLEKQERLQKERLQKERLQKERLVNQPTQKKENSKLDSSDTPKIKQNLIYIGFVGLIIFGLYYFMSPYQNCIRLGEESLTTTYNKMQSPSENRIFQWRKKDYNKITLSERIRKIKIQCIGGTSW